jgi:hypothetical protein
MEALMAAAQSPDTFTKFIFGLLASLMAAGVIGIWSMSNSVARMDERMSSYIQVQRETNESVSKRLEQVDVRLRMLERTSQP